ncbi:MAG: hypothetical protein M3Y27_18600 [Acidobacteriota bacterium]|nr:hypothetical protein [Acidobacteriota bacterium]
MLLLSKSSQLFLLVALLEALTEKGKLLNIPTAAQRSQESMGVRPRLGLQVSDYGGRIQIDHVVGALGTRAVGTVCYQPE